MLIDIMRYLRRRKKVSLDQNTPCVLDVYLVQRDCIRGPQNAAIHARGRSDGGISLIMVRLERSDLVVYESCNYQNMR